MEYQENWTRPTLVEDKAEMKDYYEQLELYPEELTGQWFDVTVVFAYIRYVTTNSKKSGKKQQNEVLKLILRINDSNYYLEMDIWGRRRAFSDETNGWTDWGKNPSELQDFLYIVKKQKPKVKELFEHYDYSTPYEDRECYPHICGTQLKCVAGKKGEREYKGRYYDVNQYSLFDVDGRSAVEIEMKVDPKKKDDIRVKLNKFKSDYLTFKGEVPDESTVSEIKADSAPLASAMKVQQVEQTEPMQSPDNREPIDDLPF